MGEFIDKKLIRVKVYGLILVSYLFETSWVVRRFRTKWKVSLEKWLPLHSHTGFVLGI